MVIGSGTRSFWTRRVSRRTALKGVSAAGLALAAGGLAGCGGSEQKALPTGAAGGATPTVVRPKPGGVIQYSYAGQFIDLHPQLREHSRNYAYDHLFNYDYVNGRYELMLATSLENPDPLTYIFKMNPKAKHHNLPPVNGRTVTSEDVKVSWEAFVVNPRTANKGIFTDFVDHYEVPDDATFVAKMKKPNTWAIGPHGFGGPFPGVVAPKEMFAGDLLTKSCVGPGGFVLDKFDASSFISFKRRPDGWHRDDGRPYLDRVVYTTMLDSPVRAAALKSRQIDILVARDRLEAEEFQGYGADMRVRKELGLPPTLYLRSDNEGYFKDPRVREAVYASLNIKDLIDKVSLGEGEFTGPVPPYLANWALPDAELRKNFPVDVKKARDLLTAAGWDFNREVELKLNSLESMLLLAQALQQQLQAAGIKIKLVPQDTTTVFQSVTMQNRDFQMAVQGGASLTDPDFRLRQHTTIGGGNGNAARWSDPEVDEIVARQATEFDPNKQKQTILEAQRMLFKKFSPAILLFCPYTYTAYWDYLHNAWLADNGYMGSLGLNAWIDVDHPAYPKDRK